MGKAFSDTKRSPSIGGSVPTIRQGFGFINCQLADMDYVRTGSFCQADALSRLTDDIRKDSKDSEMEEVVPSL